MKSTPLSSHQSNRLAAAVVAVSPDGQPGARPVPADAAGQVLQQGADLDTGRRLAGAQENRHRPAALDMVDVDRKEAPRIVMRVEQRPSIATAWRAWISEFAPAAFAMLS